MEKLYVLSVKLFRMAETKTVVGVYSTPQLAKDAARFHLQCDALESTIEWTPYITETRNGDEVTGYVVFEGQHANEVEINIVGLNNLY